MTSTNTVTVLCLLILNASGLSSQPLSSDSTSAIDSGYVSVDGGKLYYEIAGEGSNIVLLHDGVVHREIWNAQFPVLAKSYRVVRYDRRGYGKSSNPQAPFSNIEDMNRLLTQLRIDKAIIFGMSAGGGLAIDFTLKFPGKVTALVLVGAVVSGYGYSSHMLTRGGRIHSFAELVASPPKLMEYLAWEDPYEMYPENIKAKEEFMRLLEANPIDITPDKYSFSKPAEKSAAKFLSEIGVPTLVLVGEYDIPDVQAHAGVIEFGIPDAKREIIPKSGHLIPLEQPEAFNISVLKFFKKHGFRQF